MTKVLRVLACALLLASAAVAGPFEDGAAANRAGNYKKAIEIWRPWAEQGHNEAEFALGSMYDAGRGVSKDRAEAMKWFVKAAEHGHAGAQFTLGAACYTGEGIQRDYAAAATWIRRASDQGDKLSQYVLARMYVEGIGVQKDAVEALKWVIIYAAGKDYIEAVTIRDGLIRRMSADQVAQAQQLASKWKVKLEPQSP